MIRVAVVEDEESCRAQLGSFLLRYQKETGREIRVTMFTDGDQIAGSYRPGYDIILMDVQMKVLDGMTAAEVIRRQDPEVIIIFITNMAQYAIRGYAVDALDYVLKPVNYFAFSQRLDRAMDRLERKKTHYITITVKGGAQKLDISRIRYIESSGHTLVIHTRGEDYLTSVTMKEMEDLLECYGFCRCNKGYLVNLDHVDAIRDGCVIVGEERLLISRGRKNTFLEVLTNHMAGGTK